MDNDNCSHFSLDSIEEAAEIFEEISLRSLECARDLRKYLESEKQTNSGTIDSGTIFNVILSDLLSHAAGKALEGAQKVTKEFIDEHPNAKINLQ